MTRISSRIRLLGRIRTNIIREYSWHICEFLVFMETLLTYKFSTIFRISFLYSFNKNYFFEGWFLWTHPGCPLCLPARTSGQLRGSAQKYIVFAFCLLNGLRGGGAGLRDHEPLRSRVFFIEGLPINWLVLLLTYSPLGLTHDQ